MRPSLDQLEALLWISRLGGFRQAAAKLNLSQPAISSRIREMEEQLGFTVLDRSAYVPQLTSAGQEVVRHAEQMIALAEGFRGRLMRQTNAPSSIRLGAADTFALTYLSILLERLASLYPGTQVELDIDFSAKLDRKLKTGDLDIAFLTSPDSHEAVHSEPLLHLELGWIASPRLLLKQGFLTPPDLLALPIITNPRPSHLYHTVTEWFAEEGYVAQRVHTCTSLTIMTKLAVDGFGIAVIPLILVQEELRQRRLVALPTKPIPSHYIHCAYRLTDETDAYAAVAMLAQSMVERGAARFMND